MNTKLPKHVAIVMDGNGRWAQKRGLLRFEGHKVGLKTVKEIIYCCINMNIPILSLYSFSMENWSRPKKEIDYLMRIFNNALKYETQSLHNNNIRLKFIGDKKPLSYDIRYRIRDAEKLTKQNNKLILNIFLNYSGKWDIIQTVRKICHKIYIGKYNKNIINESFFNNFISTKHLPNPDLFIRTGGEQRISNFFLWQLAYTELYFTNILWPDFNEKEFKKAIFDFSLRSRRYGKI